MLRTLDRTGGVGSAECTRAIDALSETDVQPSGGRRTPALSTVTDAVDPHVEKPCG